MGNKYTCRDTLNSPEKKDVKFTRAYDPISSLHNSSEEPNSGAGLLDYLSILLKGSSKVEASEPLKT